MKIRIHVQKKRELVVAVEIEAFVSDDGQIVLTKTVLADNGSATVFYLQDDKQSGPFRMKTIPDKI
jgi:hypothetical protein